MRARWRRRVGAMVARSVVVGLLVVVAGCGAGDGRSTPDTTASTAVAGSTTAAAANTTVVLAPGVNPPATGPAGTVVHDQGGVLSACTATWNGTANATYAPTLLFFEPT